MKPEALARIRRLDLMVSRRIEGRLEGEHKGLLPGPGREAGDARPYAPGDDVRRIDWNVTARAAHPYVRDTEADHELETTLIIDVSGSMSFGTGDGTKREVAVSAAAVFAFATAGAGDRNGAVLLGEQPVWIPHRPGRNHVYRILGGVEATAARGRVDLERSLWAVAHTHRRRGLVVVVSDFLDPGSWERPLRAVRSRHETVAIQVVDPRELELADIGVARMEDAETGRQSWIDTSDGRLRRRYATRAAARDREIARRLRRSGVHHLRLTTQGDWLGEVIGFVLDRRRMMAGTGRSA